jgi:hypothetical protein
VAVFYLSPTAEPGNQTYLDAIGSNIDRINKALRDRRG